MTTVVRQIGTRATEMGERFGSGGYRALAGDVSGFARSSPGLFLLAAAGAGFAVGRIVRNADTKAIASAAREQDTSGDLEYGSPALSTSPDLEAITGMPQPGLAAGGEEFLVTGQAGLDPSSTAALGEV